MSPTAMLPVAPTELEKVRSMVPLFIKASFAI